MTPIRLAAPALADLPNGPGSTLGCLRSAVLLVTDSLGCYVLLVQGPGDHHPGLRIEVAGLPVETAQGVLAELDALRFELNVYRGHMLDVAIGPMGNVILGFTAPPGLTRDDVVLPGAVLDRIERHALGVAEHRDALLAVGQHLKRGLLLYGPPGTGKTHTTRYLLGQMTGYTRLVLTGRSLVAVGPVTELLPAPCSPRWSSARTSTWWPRTGRWDLGLVPFFSTCSTRWTARRQTPTCCSCSPRTGLTCWNRPSPPAPAASTSRWRSTSQRSGECRLKQVGPVRGEQEQQVGVCRPLLHPRSSRSKSRTRHRPVLGHHEPGRPADRHHWPPGPAGWTSRSRLTCPTPRPASGC